MNFFNIMVCGYVFGSNSVVIRFFFLFDNVRIVILYVRSLMEDEEYLIMYFFLGEK